LLMAGNQFGKTLAGGFEVAMHATGRYLNDRLPAGPAASPVRWYATPCKRC
jgi:hypothetical protein